MSVEMDMVTGVMGAEVNEDETELNAEGHEAEAAAGEHASEATQEQEGTEEVQEKEADAGKQEAAEGQPTEAELAQQALEDIDRSSPAYQGIIKDLQTERARRHELETKMAELEQSVKAGRQAQPAQQEAVAPVTISQLREKYELTDDEAPTLRMLEELESSQRIQAEKEAATQVQSRQEEQTAALTRAYVEAETALIQELGSQADVLGLGYAQVVTEKNILLLNGLDWQEVRSKPAEQRPALVYQKIVTSHPQLKDKYAAYQSAKKQQPKGGPKVPPTVPAKQPGANAPINFTQQDVLDGKVDLGTHLYGPEEPEQT